MPLSPDGLSNAALLDPSSVTEAVRGLLAPGGITMVTQPLVRTTDGSVVGYEALARARWLDMPPDQWLDLAGREGARMEAELACLRAASELGTPPHGARLFLNLSPRLLFDPRLDAALAALPDHVLEVTEHEPVHDYPALMRRVVDLVGRSSLIAVDDVGAGYASMSHVLRLSPHFLKIDRSMICDLHRDRDQRAMVRAIAAFARSTGAECIAEGVETVEELEALRDIGIGIAQGYLLARPGAGWPAVNWPSHLTTEAEVLRDKGESLPVRLANARDVVSAADVVTTSLFGEHLLPSVYLDRGGVLRCVSRFGQWLVLDGLPPGIGMTGAAFADGHERWAADVHADPAYRTAVPGVCSELSIPLAVRGSVVGVLNVESLTPMTTVQLQRARSAARHLEERLEGIPNLSDGPDTVHVLARIAPDIIAAESAGDLAQRTVVAALQTSEMPTAALWWHENGTYRLAAATGPASDDVMSLQPDQVQAIADLATDVASCHTGGGQRDLAAGPLAQLRQHGAQAAIIVPLRSRGRGSATGVLLTVSAVDATISANAVLATELLTLYAAAVHDRT